MSDGIWLSAAGMKINDHRQEVLTNNMANAHTTGFKRDLAVIRQRPVESVEDGPGMDFLHPVLDGLAGGVEVQQSYHDFSQGPIEQTKRPLDAAIVGQGFFVVGDGKNQRLTRDGTFAVNANRELVLAAGDGKWHVQDDAGGVIQFDPDLPAPRIMPDGTIKQGDEVVTKLRMVDVADKQALRKSGENLFELPKGEPEDIAPRVEPGARELANFDVMSGLASMIEATRAYELNANLLRLQDQMTGELANTVGRLS